MAEKTERTQTLSVQALQRMPYYIHCLRGRIAAGETVISAPALAADLGLHEVQVRKDLAAVSPTHGKPKKGFMITELLENMEELLGYHKRVDAVLVGAGSLGTALLSYQGFENYGVRLVAAFDRNPALVGTKIAGKPVLAPEQLPEFCRESGVKIGVITVPVDAAQEACDLLVSCGVLAVWNFAPVHLTTPAGILVQNENIAASLALLSKHLSDRQNEGGRS